MKRVLFVRDIFAELEETRRKGTLFKCWVPIAVIGTSFPFLELHLPVIAWWLLHRRRRSFDPPRPVQAKS